MLLQADPGALRSGYTTSPLRSGYCTPPLQIIPSPPPAGTPPQTPPRTPREGGHSPPHTPRSQMGSAMLCPKTPMQTRSPNTRLFSPCGEPLDNVSILSRSFDHDPIASTSYDGPSPFDPPEQTPIPNHFKKFSNKSRGTPLHGFSPAMSVHSVASVLGSSGPGVGSTLASYEAQPLNLSLDVLCACRYEHEFVNHVEQERDPQDRLVVSMAQHIADKATYTIRRLKRPAAVQNPTEVPELQAVAGAESQHIPRYFYSWVDPSGGGGGACLAVPRHQASGECLCIQLEDVCSALEVVGAGGRRPPVAALPELVYHIAQALDDAHMRNICFGPVQAGDIRLVGPTRATAVWKLCNWTRSYNSSKAEHKVEDCRGLARFLRGLFPGGAAMEVGALLDDVALDTSRYTAYDLVQNAFTLMRSC
eukprot:TRINITY_DN3399_c0_g1_i1.p1 TRINITY_DN3399_c0_g1~~TRINITY_DN3399_c0_g1_i1.p1  ORF type:complete len:420 (+),score=103.11 TRINITY_DN3399_c0_g1_i1:98-1357(+)